MASMRRLLNVCLYVCRIAHVGKVLLFTPSRLISDSFLRLFSVGAGLQLTGPSESVPIYLNQALNLTWKISATDPATWGVESLCDGTALPISTVHGADDHTTIPVYKLLKSISSSSPFQVCTLQARNSSNNVVLASTAPFFVLSSNAPTNSSSLSSSAPSTPTLSETTHVISTTSLLSFTSTFSTSLSGTSSLPPPSSNPGPVGNLLPVTGTGGSSDILSGTTVDPNFPMAQSTNRPGFTNVAETTTIVFTAHSSRSTTVITFTTEIPISSLNMPSMAPGATQGNHTRAIVGGVIGSFFFLCILISALFIFCRRKRRQHSSGQTLSPLTYQENYIQPPEKSARGLGDIDPEIAVVNSLPYTSSHMGTESDDDLLTETLTPTSSSEAILQEQLQRMRERILQLEGERRGLSNGTWSPIGNLRPPDYTESEGALTV